MTQSGIDWVVQTWAPFWNDFTYALWREDCLPNKSRSPEGWCIYRRPLQLGSTSNLALQLGSTWHMSASTSTPPSSRAPQVLQHYPPKLIEISLGRPKALPEGIQNMIKFQHRMLIYFWNQNDVNIESKSYQESIPKPIQDLRSIVHWHFMVFGPFGSWNIANRLKTIYVSHGSAVFASITFLIPKSLQTFVPKSINNQSNNDHKHDLKNHQILIQNLTPTWPQQGCQNRSKFDFGATLNPRMGPRCSKRAPETQFGRFVIDFEPIWDGMLLDFGSTLDWVWVEHRHIIEMLLQSFLILIWDQSLTNHPLLLCLWWFRPSSKKACERSGTYHSACAR